MEYFRVTVDVLAWDEQSAMRIATKMLTNGPPRLVKVEPIAFPGAEAKKASAPMSESKRPCVLTEALTILRDRLKAHPSFAVLTEAEELLVGGDTAELSYLARIANEAIRKGK